MRGLILLIATVLLAFAADAQEAKTPDVDLAALKQKYKRPAAVLFLEDNPYSDAKYTLGKDLFFDPRLSASGVTSCSTCHNPGLNWTDGMAHGVGFHHEQLLRKTPTLLNLAWDDSYFWDGRADTLEVQAPIVFELGKVMNMPFPDVIKHIHDIPGYKPLFEAAFPGEKDPVTRENIGKALALFERMIVSGTAPFDKWIDGDEEAISEPAKRGFVLFNTKAACSSCHSGWRFSDSSFHDTGMPDADPGRGKFLPDIMLMQHAFKTVGLRNIVERAPYMHDGSLKTLADVIDFYNGKFVQRPSLATEIKPLNLTAEEKQDLVVFLQTLSSEDAPVTFPQLPH